MAFNPNNCAACGAIGDLHEHHILPKVHVGDDTPTVWLCVACHGRVHSRQFDPNHKALHRAAMAKAKEAGKCKGRKPHGRASMIHGLAKEGVTREAIAKRMGISERSVYRALKVDPLSGRRPAA
jgi:hypothetical protein